VLIKQAKKRSA